MQLHGWIRSSLIEYTGHIATVLFTGGCNFRCPMCHNAALVQQPGALPRVPEEAVWEFLEKRAGQVTGLIVSGGEPTLQPDLADFLRRARSDGVDIKLDTNGYRPDVLGELLDAGLVDYVAMDIKAPPDKYARLSGTPGVDVGRIERSIALLCESGTAHEFRTTVVPGMLDAEDIEAIAFWLGDAGARRYVLQQFRGQHTLDPALTEARPYAAPVLRAMVEQARRWVADVALRGVIK